MKHWLRNKLHNFIFPQDCAESTVANSLSTSIGGRHHKTLSSETEPLRFSVYNASGGKIVEISHYDQKRDRHDTNLHIIGSDEDFGESIGKIAFIELLKKGH